MRLRIRRLKDLRSGAVLVSSLRLFQDLVARYLKEWRPKLVVLVWGKVSLLAPLRDTPTERWVNISLKYVGPEELLSALNTRISFTKHKLHISFTKLYLVHWLGPPSWAADQSPRLSGSFQEIHYDDRDLLTGTWTVNVWGQGMANLRHKYTHGYWD